jgi:hypothetical protein
MLETSREAPSFRLLERGTGVVSFSPKKGVDEKDCAKELKGNNALPAKTSPVAFKMDLRFIIGFIKLG